MRAFSKIETISVEFSKLSIAPAIDSSSRFKTELMLGEISNQVLDTFWIILISWNVEFTFSTKRENAGVLGAYTSFPLS